MKSGIYAIINEVNGKFYVGSAVNIRKRWTNHISDLRKGIHRNKHLRRAWKKYGEESFKFRVLESVENKEDLLGREQYWMDLLKPKYNILPTAGSSLGYKRTEESKQKVSGENCPSYKHAKCFEYKGKSRPLSDWAKEFGFDPRYIQTRVNVLGWSLERALTTPVLPLEGENHPMFGRTGENSNSYKRAKCWEYNGKSQPLSAWAKEYNISPGALKSRINVHKWSFEKALLTPVRPKISSSAKKEN